MTMARKQGKAQWRVFQRPDKSGAPQWVVAFRIPPARWRDHRISKAAKVAIDDQPAAEAYAKRFVAKLGAVVAERSDRKARTSDEATTVATFAEEWTSGKLHRKWPDHVKLKSSSPIDAARFRQYVNPIAGDVPLEVFTVDHGERIMRALPDDLSGATRRQVAQLLHRLFAMAVHPARIIEANPLPRGFLPKVKLTKAFSYLYPAEDRTLLGCPTVPLHFRMLFGTLAREGMRLGEALGLRWSDVDLERGAVRLDENKTDDPRAWALDASVPAGSAPGTRSEGSPHRMPSCSPTTRAEPSPRTAWRKCSVTTSKPLASIVRSCSSGAPRDNRSGCTTSAQRS